MITSALLALSLAVQVAPTPLVPTGPWTVRGEETMCLLERKYVSGTQTISLVFHPLSDLSEMEVFVIAPDGSDTKYEGKFSASVSGAERSYTGRYLSAVSGKNGRLTRLTTQRRMLEDLVDGDMLHIRAEPVNQSFTITNPEKVRGILQECIDDLKKKASSIDPNPTAPKAQIDPNAGRYFGSDAYPPQALRQGVHGRVVTLLDIDANGAVANCRVVSSVGEALNEGTCTAAKRIRFKPARGRDGKPLPSTFVLPVNWVMPISTN